MGHDTGCLTAIGRRIQKEFGVRCCLFVGIEIFSFPENRDYMATYTFVHTDIVALCLSTLVLRFSNFEMHYSYDHSSLGLV